MTIRLLSIGLLTGSLSWAACAARETAPPKLEMSPLDAPGQTLRLDPASASSTESPRAAGDAGTRDAHHVELTVGEIATLPAKGIRSFSVANANIDVRLSPDGSTFVVAGRAKGRCDLLLIHKDGTQEIFTVEVFDR